MPSSFQGDDAKKTFYFTFFILIIFFCKWCISFFLLVYFFYFYCIYRYDYLRITDGSTFYTIGTYCGYQTGKRVRVDGSVAVLTFHTDGSVQRGGFYLSFSFFRQPLGEYSND